MVDKAVVMASMRPPQNAGESFDVALPAALAGRRFNEAPAERGGKSGDGPRHDQPRRASMRPPQNAGESWANGVPAHAAATRFNEAPAERGGK